MRSETEFIDCFGSRFWKKLNESLVPFDDAVAKKKIGKLDFLANLYRSINERSYHPKPVREYIVFDKHNAVSRIVPTFIRNDYCVYFYCLKSIEQFLCKGRIQGTFGGWTLNNGLKEQEDSETEETEELILEEIVSFSAPDTSYNPLAWRTHWREFQRLSHNYYLDEKYETIMSFDIANFYDSINLALLEKRIRNCMYKSAEDGELIEDVEDELDLLFYFLSYWNKPLEGYKPKTVGVPQDEVGDCSRILANFYLQGYDKKMKELCDEYGATYLRYADDQVIFSPSTEIANRILFAASKELHLIGLNINSSKVKRYSREEFAEYWAFDFFEMLTDEKKDDSDVVNKAVALFLQKREEKVQFRWDSALNRLLSCNLSDVPVSQRYSLIKQFFDSEYLQKSHSRVMGKILKILTQDQKEDLFKALDDLMLKVHFNSFHYHLLAFYKKHRSEFPNQGIHDRIRAIKL